MVVAMVFCVLWVVVWKVGKFLKARLDFCVAWRSDSFKVEVSVYCKCIGFLPLVACYHDTSFVLGTRLFAPTLLEQAKSDMEQHRESSTRRNSRVRLPGEYPADVDLPETP